MKFLVAAMLGALLLVAPQAGARDRAASPAVTQWVQIQLADIASHRTNPPRAARGLALTSVAMLDASNVPQRFRRAAVAGAAATVLAYLYPDRAAAFDELAERERPRVALALGRSIGARVVARGRRDGSDAVFQGTIPVGPGLWVPTPPAFAPPLEALAGTWRPWNISSGSRFRPGPRWRSEAGAMPKRCARSTTSRGRSPRSRSGSPTSGPTVRER